MAENLGHGEARENQASTSVWPIALAATLTVVVAGLVVHPIISVIAALLSIAVMVAWTAQRFHVPAPVAIVPRKPRPQPADSISAARPSPSHAQSKTGRWGLIWFIATEAVFFGNLISAYIFLRVQSEAWPPPGTPHLEILFPSVNTVILLASGIPAYYADKAIKKGNLRGLRIGLILSALLGAVFLSGQVYEYINAGFTPQANVFAAGFFVLTGFHGAHVLAGVGLLLAVAVMSFRGRISAQRSFAVDVATTYWHFVDVVWIFLFTLLYLIR